MVKKMVVLTLLILLSGTAYAQEDPTCKADCDKKAQKCSDEASAIYITCGQQGGSDEECLKKKLAYLASCGCSRCSRIESKPPFGTWLKSWYCACGEPLVGEETASIDDCGVRNYEGECTSPICVDLAGNGLHFTDVDLGVLFDLRGNSSPVQTSWTDPLSDDAWLVLDRNQNGTIDDGRELFGNFTLQPDSPDRNGFLALAEFDKPANGGNGDGVITSQDSVFADLRLWRDANQNGISEPTELLTLASAGINELGLAYIETLRTDRYGNLFRYRAKVNGAHSMWDVFLINRRP